MLIKINTPVNLEVKELKDLSKLGVFMEQNKLKTNKFEVARSLGVDRRTVDKYLKGYEKKTTRKRKSALDEYYEIIKFLLESNTQIFHYKRNLYRYLVDNHNLVMPESTFYNYLKKKPEFNKRFKKTSTNRKNNPVIRYETHYGEQAQLDWKESIPFILADTGEVMYLP